MGEYAEMMLDGMVCQWCGEFMGEGDGFPTICAGCQAAEGVDQFGRKPEELKRTMECSEKGCHRKFKTHDAYLQHWRDKHDTAGSRQK